MSWKWRIALVALIIFILVVDQGYFERKRENFSGGFISESFIRKGVLGKLLMQNGFLEIKPQDKSFAAENLCASDNELSGFDYHDSVRLRIYLKTPVEELLTVRISPVLQNNIESDDQEIIVPVGPNRDHYAVNFRIGPDKPFKIVLYAPEGPGIKIGSVIIDGRYGRSYTIVHKRKLLKGRVSNRANPQMDIAADAPERWLKQLRIGKPIPEMVFELSDGLPGRLLSGGFPGKKNHGHCSYGARRQPRATEKKLLPRVDIVVDEDKWSGPRGVLSNRLRARGRAWELPARMIVNQGEVSLNQIVGLRFHGGVSVRVTGAADSYRVYSRKAYGKNWIDHRAFSDVDRGVDYKTLIFKTTKQANFPKRRQDFNPFNHALALDIADRIGALVPDHFLVDLYLNGKSQGVYLGLEQLSDKSVKSWLKHDKFETYTYRNENTESQKDLLDNLVSRIRHFKGEQALIELEKIYDLPDIMNSVLLTAYIANFDFCQGMEIFTDIENENSDYKVTTINWDLDYAFLFEQDRKLHIRGDHIGFPTIDPSFKKKFHDCSRARIYSWVYGQSPRFRKLFRKHVEDALKTSLSPVSIAEMLKYYRSVNVEYLDNRYTSAIEDLQKYAQTRPAKLLLELDQMESNFN
ncbi:MAG: hypothetical protein ACI8P9_001547 [Parasphingorhabdus sp.]|jgi:hypothetical protein